MQYLYYVRICVTVREYTNTLFYNIMPRLKRARSNNTITVLDIIVPYGTLPLKYFTQSVNVQGIAIRLR